MFKWNFLFILVLMECFFKIAHSAVNSNVNSNSNVNENSNKNTDALKVVRLRGTLLPLPFRLRVLMDDFEVSSSRSQAGIDVGGHELLGVMGEDLLTEKVKCRYSVDKMPKLLKGVSDLSKYFLCEVGKRKIVLNETGIHVRAKAGFLTYRNKILRGSVHLLRQNHRVYIVNEIPLDPYLAGLANKEMGPQFSDEALKAQIVAARSYAIASAADRRLSGMVYDLKSTEADQVYAGFLPEDSRTYRLAKATTGQILVHQEDILKAFYHSSNGGFTELPSHVWGNSQKKDEYAYRVEKSEADAAMESNKWTIQISPKMGLAWADYGDVLDIKILERTQGHRVKKIQISGTLKTESLSGAEFRSRFGNRWIKSTLFSISKTKNGWSINGRGWGHGVGLSQYGAERMAKAGKNFAEILSFYYPNANLRYFDFENDRPVDLLAKQQISKKSESKKPNEKIQAR